MRIRVISAVVVSLLSSITSQAIAVTYSSIQCRGQEGTHKIEARVDYHRDTAAGAESISYSADINGQRIFETQNARQIALGHEITFGDSENATGANSLILIVNPRNGFGLVVGSSRIPLISQTSAGVRCELF